MLEKKLKLNGMDLKLNMNRFRGYAPILRVEIKDPDKYCKKKIEKCFFTYTKGSRNEVFKEDFQEETRLAGDLFHKRRTARKELSGVLCERNRFCF